MSVLSDLYKIKDIKKDIFNEIKNKKSRNTRGYTV